MKKKNIRTREEGSSKNYSQCLFAEESTNLNHSLDKLFNNIEANVTMLGDKLNQSRRHRVFAQLCPPRLPVNNNSAKIVMVAHTTETKAQRRRSCDGTKSNLKEKYFF